MDYASILSYQTMYLQGPACNTYSFDMPYPSMNYIFPFYQASPSFAYYLSNSPALTKGQVNIPQSIAAEEVTLEPELGPKLNILPSCRKIKAT